MFYDKENDHPVIQEQDEGAILHKGRDELSGYEKDMITSFVYALQAQGVRIETTKPRSRLQSYHSLQIGEERKLRIKVKTMNERKRRLIEEATKLFGQKGYHATSIQDIVDHSGMSKGSFYNYFSSKEELILSIIKYHYEILFESMDIFEQENLNEKEKLIKQLQAQLEYIFEHKDLIQMQMQEQVLPVNEEIHQMMFKMRAQSIKWLRRRLIDVYGNSISAYALDCVALMNGMMKEYVFHILFDRKELALDEVIIFLMRRMDAIVHSFTPGETSILTDSVMEDFIHAGELKKQEQHKQIIQLISQMREILQSAEISKRQLDKIISSLDAMESEFADVEQEPREYIVEGLLLYLQNQQLPVLEHSLPALAASIKSYF